MLRKKQLRKNASNTTILFLNKTNNDSDTKQSGINLLQVIGLLVSLTGIIGAFFWILGRFYYGGMFAYYGVPFTPALSNEDYLESGVFYFWGTMMDVLMFAITYSFALLIWKDIGNFLERIKKYPYYKPALMLFYVFFFGGAYLLYYYGNIKLGDSFTSNPSNIFIILLVSLGLQSLKFMFTNYESKIGDYFGLTWLFVAGLIVLLTHLGVAYRGGYTNACQAVLSKPIFITMYSDKPLSLSEQIIQQNLFVYKDYSLLFVDKENYYLSEATDINNNRPDGLLIIKKNDIKATEIFVNKVAADKEKENTLICKNQSYDMLPIISLHSDK